MLADGDGEAHPSCGNNSRTSLAPPEQEVVGPLGARRRCRRGQQRVHVVASRLGQSVGLAVSHASLVRVDGRGPTGSCAAHLYSPPGAGVVNAVPPASADATSVIILRRVRPPRGIAQVEALPDEFGQAEVPGEGGRKEQPGIGHQAAVVEGDLDPVGVVASIQFRGIFCVIPEAQEHLLAASGR